MRYFSSVFVLAVCLIQNSSLAQAIPEIEAYLLPVKAKQSLIDLAAASDVFILGEMHGTQEVPQIAADLLESLDKLGFGVLALEIPADQKQPLIRWATGKTTDVPPFFNKTVGMEDGGVTEDGRGNVQVLSLIRTALSPPFDWKLICFADPWSAVAYSPNPRTTVIEQPPPTAGRPDEISFAVEHEKRMAIRLANEHSQLTLAPKVLGICGSIHARTSQTCRPDSPFSFPPEHPVMKIWPSFAAAIQIERSGCRVRSVRIEPHSGGSFSVISTAQDPTPRTGVHPIRSKKQVEEAIARQCIEEYWNMQLDLPRATPATFLDAKPVNKSSVENPTLREELLKRAREDQAVRKELIANGIDKPNEELRARMKHIDADNQSRLKALVEEHGWPTAQLVGKDAVQEAFLLVQHAHDPAFQKQMLPLIEESYKAGDLEGQNYALLVDRIRVREGQPQIYGTQARPTAEWKDKEPCLMPIEDEANVERRRAEVGLPPLALYLKILKRIYFPGPTPP